MVVTTCWQHVDWTGQPFVSLSRTIIFSHSKAQYSVTIHPSKPRQFFWSAHSYVVIFIGRLNCNCTWEGGLDVDCPKLSKKKFPCQKKKYLVQYCEQDIVWICSISLMRWKIDYCEVWWTHTRNICTLGRASNRKLFDIRYIIYDWWTSSWWYEDKPTVNRVMW